MKVAALAVNGILLFAIAAPMASASRFVPEEWQQRVGTVLDVADQMITAR